MDYYIRGIDVSVWQGDIDFSEVARSGIDIVYIRSSIGSSTVDSKFKRNYIKAKDAGLRIGFYHYVTARSEEEAIDQARFFASVIAGLDADCRLAMDFETFGNLKRNDIYDIADTFLREVEAKTDKEVVIYSDYYNAKYYFKDLLDEYPLWIAQYDVDRPSISKYAGWQYKDDGKVDGIRSLVDRDLFTPDIYLSDTSTIREPDVSDKKTIYYRVKRGDTLYIIAHKYNVTIKELVKWNDLRNPNLIYPGEIIKIYVDYDYIEN